MYVYRSGLYYNFMCPKFDFMTPSNLYCYYRKFVFLLKINLIGLV